MSDTSLNDLWIVLAVIVEIQDFLIMHGRSAMETLLEIAFQIGRFQLPYRGVMSVWLKDHQR